MKKSDREYKGKRKAEMIAALEKADDPRAEVHERYKVAIKGIVFNALLEFMVYLHQEKQLTPSQVEAFVSDFVEKNCIPCD